MRAVKGNKEYMITEGQRQAYQNAGFDIFEGEKQIAYGRGKTVPYGDYAELRKQLETSEEEKRKLREELERLKTNTSKRKAGE